MVARPDGSAPALRIAPVAEDVPAATVRPVGAGGTEVASAVVKPWVRVVGHVRELNGLLVQIATVGD